MDTRKKYDDENIRQILDESNSDFYDSSDTDSFEESIGSADDPTYNLNNDVSSNEEFNSPSSEDSDGEQNNANIDNLSIDFEDISSDWEDDFNDIEDFNFDEFGAGVQLDITDEATPYDVFIKIWDDEVMQLILNSSNKYGEKLKKLKRPHTKNCRIQHFKEISLIELQKFFGLCLLRAELGIPVLRQCFGKDPLNYHPIFSFTMSGRRFEQILGALNCSEGVPVEYKGHFIDYHREIVTKLIHLPTDITNGHQLIKKDKGKSSTNSNIPSHSQEKIPLPEGWSRKTYFLSCRECYKQKIRKNTSWRCKDCPSKPPLCPGPCFTNYHS
ncbi:hypothetical protein ACI65C_004849 [Semiaphis heraclei]